MCVYRLCIIAMYIQTVGLVLRLKSKKSKLFYTFILSIFIAYILRGREHWKHESFSITFINMVVAVLFCQEYFHVVNIYFINNWNRISEMFDVVKRFYSFIYICVSWFCNMYYVLIFYIHITIIKISKLREPNAIVIYY